MGKKELVRCTFIVTTNVVLSLFKAHLPLTCGYVVCGGAALCSRISLSGEPFFLLSMFFYKLMNTKYCAPKFRPQCLNLSKTKGIVHIKMHRTKKKVFGVWQRVLLNHARPA
jgi:hypothetical protein